MTQVFVFKFGNSIFSLHPSPEIVMFGQSQINIRFTKTSKLPISFTELKKLYHKALYMEKLCLKEDLSWQLFPFPKKNLWYGNARTNIIIQNKASNKGIYLLTILNRILTTKHNPNKFNVDIHYEMLSLLFLNTIKYDKILLQSLNLKHNSFKFTRIFNYIDTHELFHIHLKYVKLFK